MHLSLGSAVASGMTHHTKQFWTADEEAYLREHYGHSPSAEIAKHLNRNVGKVYNKALKLGLMKPRNCATDEQIIAAVRELHPKGYVDQEIAEVVAKRISCEGVDRHRVGRLRQSLGLPVNKTSPRQRAKVAVATRKQLDNAGLESMAELRRARWDDWKRNLGWPDSLTVRAVQSLEMFYRHGPLTRVQLCQLLGVSSKKRTAPISNAPGGTVLAELTRAGLISSCVKAVPLRGQAKGGKTKVVNLYFLNPGVEPNHEQRQRSTAPSRSESTT